MDRFLQRAVPFAEIDIHRPHLDAVLPGVGDELGRGIKTHRLAVEEAGREGGWVVAFDPSGGVDQKRKAGRVRFGETVFSEAADLVEETFGKLGLVTVSRHAVEQLLAEAVHHARLAARPPSRGGADRPRRA